MRHAASLACLVVAVVIGARRDARAEPPPRRSVSAATSTCAVLPWSTTAWVDLLRVELANDAIDVRPASTAAANDPAVGVEPIVCAASATSVTLTYAAGDVKQTRVLSLADVDPVARPRAIAIAMADLVREALATSSTTTPATAPPSPASTPPIAAAGTRHELDVRIRFDAVERARPATTSAPPAATPGWSIYAAATTRFVGRANTGMFGVSGAFTRDVGAAVVVVGASLLTGRAHDPLGDVDATSATIDVALLARGDRDDVRFAIGPRVEAGLVWFRGHAYDARTLESDARSPIVIAALTALGTFRIGGAFAGLVGFDVGGSLYGFGARADTRTVSELVGPMFGARIGVAWTR